MGLVMVCRREELLKPRDLVKMQIPVQQIWGGAENLHF